MAIGDLLNHTTTSLAQTAVVIIATTGECIYAIVKSSGTSSYLLTYTLSGQYGTEQTLIDTYNFPSYTTNGYSNITHLSGNIYAVSLLMGNGSPYTVWGYTFTIDNSGTITLIQGTGLYTVTNTYDASCGLERIGTSNFYVACSGSITGGKVRTFNFPSDGSTPSQVDTLTTNYAGEFFTPVWCEEGYVLICNFNQGLATVSVDPVTGALGDSLTSTLNLTGDSLALTNGNLIKIGGYYGVVYHNSEVSGTATFVVVSVSSSGVITLVDSLDHLLGSPPQQESLGTYVRIVLMGRTSTDWVIKEVAHDSDDDDGYEGTLLVDIANGEITKPTNGVQFQEDNFFLIYGSTFKRLYTGATDIGVYWCGRVDTASNIFAFDESGLVNEPVDTRARVTGIIHRLNPGEYSTEVNLGALTAGFGLPDLLEGERALTEQGVSERVARVMSSFSENLDAYNAWVALGMPPVEQYVNQTAQITRNFVCPYGDGMIFFTIDDLMAHILAYHPEGV